MGDYRSQGVCVSAPARIHCGLFSVGEENGPAFGGMGIMIREPRTEISISHSDKFCVRELSGAGTEDVIPEVVGRWLKRYGNCDQVPFHRLDRLPVKISVEHTAFRHGGFGTGTQLAMATAAALFRHFGLPLAAPEEIAPVVGRGRRSAIGTYGFFTGGLLVDSGKIQPDQLASLDFQMCFPDDWPIVIAIEKDNRGLSGQKEKVAFDRISPSTTVDRETSISIVKDEIVPAVAARDYERFAGALFEFGHRSGMLFHEIQGGPYNGDGVTRLVELIRGCGVEATSQSSWGPAVFAITRDNASAANLVRNLTAEIGDAGEVFCTRADNRGAVSRLLENVP